MLHWIIRLILILPVSAVFAEPPDCRNLKEYRLLDFWLGDWDVYQSDQKVGTNRIEAVLNSCAVIEHWKDMNGGEGKSLFYFDLSEQDWKQVWVTDRAYMKEKQQQQSPDEGVVMFQGEVFAPGGKKVLDRTRLIPQADDVRQLIEQSDDSGKTWKVTFDAIYRRPK